MSYVKVKRYRIFVFVVSIFAIPLVFLAIFFSGDKEWGWISRTAMLVIYGIGVIGAVSGFITYVVKRQPGPIAAYRQKRSSEKQQSQN